MSRLTYVGDAITMMRHKLDGKVPLIGFTGAPVGILILQFRIRMTLKHEKITVDVNGLHDRRWWQQDNVESEILVGELCR